MESSNTDLKITMQNIKDLKEIMNTMNKRIKIKTVKI